MQKEANVYIKGKGTKIPDGLKLCRGQQQLSHVEAVVRTNNCRTGGAKETCLDLHLCNICMEHPN